MIWGEVDSIKIPVTAKLVWGAVASKEGRTLTLLPNRQCSVEYSKENHPDNLVFAMDKFIKWVNKKAIVAGRKWAKDVLIDSWEVFSFDDVKLSYHYRATCYRSYGCVYMTAWAD